MTPEEFVAWERERHYVRMGGPSRSTWCGSRPTTEPVDADARWCEGDGDPMCDMRCHGEKSPLCNASGTLAEDCAVCKKLKEVEVDEIVDVALDPAALTYLEREGGPNDRDR